MSVIDRTRFRLVHDQARQLATATVWRAPDGWTVEIKPPRRSLDQNARLHAMLTEIAVSGREWAGCRRTMEEWKVIFVSAHAVATERPAELVEGLEGEVVALRESTATMSKERLGSLLDYMEAWCAQNGVTLRGENGQEMLR